MNRLVLAVDGADLLDVGHRGRGTPAGTGQVVFPVIKRERLLPRVQLTFV
jgi:hypothetical protein